MPKGIYIRKPNTSNGKYIRTPEILKKMSESHKGKKLSEEHKRKMSLAQLGHHRRGWKLSEETKKRIGLASLGNKHALGYKHSELAKNKIGLNGFHYGMLGKKSSEETKSKIRLAQMKSPNRVFKNTSIEVRLQNLLKENGIEFETNYPILGRPDIFVKPNICIFADGCYWHDCSECKTKGNPVRGTKGDKDKIITEELQKQGYTVIRLWEHEINKNQFNGLNQLIN